jgi:hypothetical protein
MKKNKHIPKQTVTLMPQFLGGDWDEFKLTKIEALENELNQKTNELNESSKIQHLLHGRLVSTAKTLREVENLLAVINAKLKDSNEYIYRLERENKNLKLSCAEWMKRAIQLQFEVLSAHGTKNK